MCRRADVGLGDVRIRDSCRCDHPADSLPSRHTIAGINPSSADKSSRRVSERGGVLVIRRGLLAVSSEGKAHRENPAMVVLVELRYGDLHTATDGEMES